MDTYKKLTGKYTSECLKEDLVRITYEPLDSIRLHTRSIWGRVFKNGPSKIYGRQPLKN